MSRTETCGVCGGQFPRFGPWTHECNQNVLNGIDAAESRSWNEIIEPNKKNSRPDFNRTYHDRLRDGFDMLSEDFDCE